MAFEILHRSFMFLRCRTRIKRPQVSALPGLRILFPGVEPILSRLQFSNHDANAFSLAGFPQQSERAAWLSGGRGTPNFCRLTFLFSLARHRCIASGALKVVDRISGVEHVA
jgi:hypothetical protein